MRSLISSAATSASTSSSRTATASCTTSSGLRCRRTWSTAYARSATTTVSRSPPWRSSSHCSSWRPYPHEHHSQPRRPCTRRLQGRRDHAVRGLRAQLDHQPHDQGAVRARRRAALAGQDVGHRLLVQDAGVLRRNRTWVQRGAWPHAGPDHGRAPGESPADHARSVRRRRHRVDRPRPVHAHDPAQRRLHLHHRRQRHVRPTKGQFSATADLGSVQKKGAVNTFQPIDPCAVALALGCSFVARSFSGDGKQVVPLIKAAIAHRGTAILDIISPCVTFNDHDGSTKSYSWVKDHEESIADVSFIPFFEEVHVDYEPGTVRDVQLHDGSHIVLKKLGEDHDPTDRQAAIKVIEEGRAEGHLVTGLLYVDTKMDDFATTEHIPPRPLKDLNPDQLRLIRDQFSQFMSEFA